jgi:hypothetical protein
MAKKFLTLRRPQSGRLEGRSAPIQQTFNECVSVHTVLC